MKESAISLETAGAGFADWVRRARRDQTIFVFLEASTPVARLIPAQAPRCTGAELASALAKATLSNDEARAWAGELQASRAALFDPEERWQ